MQPFSFFFFGYSLGGGISGRVRALNLTVPLGSGRVGSDNLGYGPGSAFSFEPVQTSTLKASYACLIFLVQTNAFRVIFHIFRSVPICIIAVNGAPVSESEKKHVVS